MEYRSIEAWPDESMKRSWSGQRGFSGFWRRNLVKLVYATGASAIGVPGWPEFAFCTASIARARIVSTESASTFLVPRSKVVHIAVHRVVCTLPPYAFQNHQAPVRRTVSHGYSRGPM